MNLHPKESGTSRRRVEAQERRAKALSLRIAGASYQQIAEALGCSVGAAHKYVKTELERLDRIAKERAEELRRLQLERLAELLISVWPKAKRGDLQAIDRALKLMQEISKLTGIAAPERHELTGPGGSQLVEKIVVMIGSRKGQDEDGT